jgi:hypothetical protein
MLWHKIYQLLFTRMRANGSTATPSTPTETAIPSSKWYRNIADLPLIKYIECVVDGNLAALIISGYPSQEQLESAWVEIAEQYADIMGDAEHKMYIKLYKELVILNIEYQQILSLIEVLTMVQYKPFEQKLNELLFTNFSFTNNREKELDTCFRLSKSTLLKIDMKKAHLDALKEKGENSDKTPTREYFQSILITLSDHSKYPVLDTITTFEFCERVKRFTQFVEKQKAEKWQKTK